MAPLSLPAVEHAANKTAGLPLLQEVLAEQQSLTAVSRFATWHESAEPAQAKYYRELIPLEQPLSGEQFAFEVDLDACSGCKACVTACHSLNGLEEDETWREVGVLLGTSSELPLLQHVTTACHHCVEPGCLSGCPVKAYDKDPLTGIVRHLDDQCIGCQYCILMCPYEVPKYSHSKGIVRKCDMCRQRLAVGEAPACVQACPNQAIRIQIVKQVDAAIAAANNVFLPASPNPSLTQPTTRYRSQHTLSANLTTGDAEHITPAHGHPALSVMLVLTQMSVGLLLIERLLQLTSFLGESLAQAFTMFALALGIIGGNTAMLHLGRPLGAWRAWTGWQTSWLSREIVLFGAYGGTLAGAAVAMVTGWDSIAAVMSTVALLFGVAGVASSAMIYIITGRAFWGAARTGAKFTLTAFILGVTLALVIEAVAGIFSTSHVWSLGAAGPYLWAVSPFLTLLKMWVESRWFILDATHRHPDFLRSLRLLRGKLRPLARVRFLCGCGGGLLLPALVFVCGTLYPELLTASAMLAVALSALALRLTGELLERHLFFIACVPAKMPGGIAP